MDKFKGISLGGLRQASGGVLGLSRKAAVTLFLLAFFDSFIICKYWQTIVQPQERVTVTEPTDVAIQSLCGGSSTYRGSLCHKERDRSALDAWNAAPGPRSVLWCSNTLPLCHRRRPFQLHVVLQEGHGLDGTHQGATGPSRSGQGHLSQTRLQHGQDQEGDPSNENGQAVSNQLSPTT